MAMDLTARLRLVDNMTAPMRRATAQIQRTETMTKKLTNSIGDFTKQVAVISSAIGLTYGLAKGFGMVRDSLDSAFKRIDTMESFERTMTVLTGSAEKTAEALAKTREAVTGTAYGLDVAAKGVQDFVTRGMEIDKATDTMAAWADAVAFYGDGSNEQLATVSDALAKMYSSGKVSMDQMNRLYDAGIDGVGMYAQAVGRAPDEVQKALSSGVISAEEFISVVSTAMMEGTNGVVKIAGAAKEAGASWGASFDNMRAAVTRGTMNIIQKIDEMLTTNGLPDMRAMIADFGSKFEEVLNKAADKVPIVTDYLMQMYEKSKPGIEWIKDVGLPAMRDGFGFVVEKAKEVASFISNNWSTIKPIVIGIAVALGSLKLAFIAMSIIQSVTSFMKAFQLATAAARLSMLGLNGAMLANPLTWIIAGIVALIAIGVLLWKNWDTIKEKALELWNNLTNAFSGIRDSLSDAMNTAKDKVLGAWESIKGGIVSSVNAIIGAINGLIRGMNRISIDVPDWVPGFGGKSFGINIPEIPSIGNSHYHGLDEVPYDRYPAILHKGEAVLPRQDAQEWREGRGGSAPSVNITGNTFNVRQESDIDAIANALYSKIKASWEAGA